MKLFLKLCSSTKNTFLQYYWDGLIISIYRECFANRQSTDNIVIIITVVISSKHYNEKYLIQNLKCLDVNNLKYLKLHR